MPKKINYQLKESELAEVELVQKVGKTPQERMRATGIRLLHLRNKPEEVANLLNVSKATVANWHSKWREKGKDSLSDEPRSGRPKKATPEYCEKLEQVMDTDPKTLGYDFTIWTAKRLMLHMEKETGISLCANTMLNVLEENDYVYRRPAHELKDLKEPEAKKNAQEVLESVKKKPRQENSNYSAWTKRL